MATNRNTAYAVITEVGGGSSGGSAFASCRRTVIAPDSTVILADQVISASLPVSYGDSLRDIQNLLADALRADVSDPELEVIFC